MPWKEIVPVEQRLRFVIMIRHDFKNFSEACRYFGISRKTGYKWGERFEREGLAGLEERSRRPRRSPNAISNWWFQRILFLKKERVHWGPKKIRGRLLTTTVERPVPASSTLGRILEAAGLVRRGRKRRPVGPVVARPTLSTALSPNEIWAVDFKGWWRVAEGKRCEPLTVRDEFSRYVLDLQAVPDARTQTVRERFERLFEQNGLPGAIRSDNGAPFASDQGVLGLSRLSAWWLVLGIDLERSRPGCPQDNGAHERLHLDIERELRGAKLEEQQAGFDEWRRSFNHERPHEALAMKCPAQVYRKSERKYEGTPEDLTYERMESRRVVKHGCISWAKHRIFISTALADWSVGLEPKEAGQWNVWFGRLLLGQLEERTLSFQRVDRTPSCNQC